VDLSRTDTFLQDLCDAAVKVQKGNEVVKWAAVFDRGCGIWWFMGGNTTTTHLFSVSHGVPVVTDWTGKLKRVICIAQERLSVRYLVNGEWRTSVLDPNQIITIN
jgi:hypothetical protein